jgi:excisionase family DNA binding protein
MRIGDQNLITRKEAAELLGVHRNTVNNWLNAGILTRIRHRNGYNVYLDRKEVEVLLYPQPKG